MPNLLKDTFNNYCGSNITHVANAYSKSEYIWLLFSHERSSIQSVSINRDGDLKVVLRNREVICKQRIPFNEYHLERRSSTYEYMSVFADEGGRVVTICENAKIPANRSYIVTKKGQLIESEYGGDLWEDRQGRNHKE